MPEAPTLVLTGKGADLIRAASATSGELLLHFSAVGQVYVIDHVGISESVRVEVDIPSDYSALRWGAGDSDPYAGQWFRSADPTLVVTHYDLQRRPGFSLPWDDFRKLLPGVADPGGNTGVLIVHHHGRPDGESVPKLPEFTAWTVGRNGVFPAALEVEPEAYGSIQLATNDAWPVADLAQNSVTIVGTGSIGSAAAVALSDLGVGRLNLVDYDRLLWHNIIRHRLGPESVGRFKVDALKSVLNDRARHYSPETKTDVSVHRMSVVGSADVFYELALESDVVVCCADGIAPRRAVNHVSRIAGVPAVFACVLGDGRIGEVFRSRPGSAFGCLQCHRSWLAEQGAIDAEADQEAAYGTGDIHKPMTAAPNDLALMGTFAAKVAMSTLLESRHGDASQRLPAEHAVVGLRPDTPLRWPYNVSRAGETVWNEVPAPRPGCATCSIA